MTAFRMGDESPTDGTVAAMSPTPQDLLAAGALFLADDDDAVVSLLGSADPVELFNLVISLAVSSFEAPPKDALTTAPLQYCAAEICDSAVMMLAAGEAYVSSDEMSIDDLGRQVFAMGNIALATGALFAALLSVEAAAAGRDPLPYAQRCCVLAAADITNES